VSPITDRTVSSAGTPPGSPSRATAILAAVVAAAPVMGCLPIPGEPNGEDGFTAFQQRSHRLAERKLLLLVPVVFPGVQRMAMAY